MAIQDWLTNVQFVARWLHVLFAILWLAQIYFLNFASRSDQLDLAILKRVLWWLRWSAMLAFLFGITLFVLTYTYPTTGNLLDDGRLTPRGIWILIGAILGTFLWIDAWFVIWPTGKKLLLMGSENPEEYIKLQKRVQFTLKINAALSGPILFAMLATGHYGAFNWLTTVVLFLFALLLFRIFYVIASKI